ncbi:hypothetical protein SLEP1_g34522 [Rubroshorea leprosula]|uniref:Uncharacterized protein n=1 Tax=Rubroshorea leprosula TaxID=152421 RepID=A0AAV5KK53_9ROSI|nr:hypothetical protein SLEP1_g34522 [Rubroshorea leprosula]
MALIDVTKCCLDSITQGFNRKFSPFEEGEAILSSL